MLIAFILCTGGCSEATEDVEELRVGLVTPKTGVSAAFGKGNEFGLNAAVEDLNALGGVYVKELGRKIRVRVIVRDSESSEVVAGTAAEQLISADKVHVLDAGNLPMPLIAPVARVAESFKVPNISCAPFEPWVTQRSAAQPPWKYSWSSGFTVASPAAQGDFRAGKSGYMIADTWIEALNSVADQTNRKVALFALDDGGGRSWYSAFPKLLQTAGYEVIGSKDNLGLFSADTKDFKAMVQAWIDAGAEILWGNSPSPQAHAVLKAARDMGYKPKVVFIGRGMLFYDDIAAWGDDLPAGVGTEVPWSEAYPAASCPGFGKTTPQTLADRWRAATGEQPVNSAIRGYHLMQVLADAVERAGTLDAEAINQALATTDLPTINCRIVYTQTEHYSRLPVSFGQWVKTNDKWGWSLPIVYSADNFVPSTGKLTFPKPW